MKINWLVALLVITVSACANAGDSNSVYSTRMSKNHKLCDLVRDILNTDLEKYGRKYNRNKFKNSVFNVIQWKSFGQPQDRRYDYGGWYAQFDIDNDGNDEVIVRRESSVSSKIIHVVYVLENNNVLKSTYRLQTLAAEADGGIVLGRKYEFKFQSPKTFTEKNSSLTGKEYFEGLSKFVEIYPLKYQRRYYILMKHSTEIGPDPNKLVVAEYVRGMVHTADPKKLRDICYME